MTVDPERGLVEMAGEGQTKRWARERGLCALLALFLLVLPEAAQAAPPQAQLTVQELLDLRALGFGEAEIRAEVDRTGTRLVLAPAEREQLERAGFSQALIQHLVQEAPPTGPPPAVAPTPAVLPTLGQQLVAVYGAPEALVGLASTWTQLGAEAVFLASRLSGGQRVVTSGTLTQIVAGTLEFQFSATPTDRLHVVMKDGTQADYYVTRFQGDLSADATTLLSGAHDIALRAVLPNQLDLELASRKVSNGPANFDGVVDSSVRGRMTFDGQESQIEVRATGTYYFENDSGGIDRRSDLRTLGTIQVGATMVRLDERWESDLITGLYQKASSDGTVLEAVSSQVRTLNSTWTVGEQKGAVRNGIVRTAFRNWVPSTNDDRFWKASGEIVVDGRAVGALRIIVVLNEFRLIVDMQPEPTVLHSWSLTKAR